MDRVEGLVRDNRVEGRVLFGALRKAPQTAGVLSSLGGCSVVVEHVRENGFENAEHRMCSPAVRGSR